jgi:hypothetical protein
MSTLHDDAKGLVGGTSTLVEKTENVLTGTVKAVTHNTTGSNVSHDLSNMAMPLAIGAVTIVAVMILKK